MNRFPSDRGPMPALPPSIKGAVGQALALSQAPGANAATKTLVLYDKTGPYAWLGEIYAQQAANLVSHFGAWTAHPVGGYKAGELAAYTGVVYVGSTYDEPLPVAFLDDVLPRTQRRCCGCTTTSGS